MASISLMAGKNFSLILSGIKEDIPFFKKVVSIRKKQERTMENKAEVRNEKVSLKNDDIASALPER